MEQMPDSSDTGTGTGRGTGRQYGVPNSSSVERRGREGREVARRELQLAARSSSSSSSYLLARFELLGKGQV